MRLHNLNHLELLDQLLLPLICLITPALLIRWQADGYMPEWLSAVVASYGLGVVLGTQPFYSFDTSYVLPVVAVGIILGLPLLIFSLRLEDSYRFAPKMLLTFGLSAGAAVIGSVAAAWYFYEAIPDGWKAAGMLTGLQTGGTANLQALGLALDAPEYVLILQGADVIGGGIYLLLLISVLHRVFGWFLPSFESPAGPDPEEAADRPRDKSYLKPMLTAIGCAGLAASFAYWIGGGQVNDTVLIVTVTTLALGISFSSQARSWRKSYPLGEYFLLVFCIGVGTLIDMSVLADQGLELFQFYLVTFVTTLSLQWLLARLFRIDRDTLMLASTAALYGPVFVAQVATAIGNRRLLAPGIAVSLLGFAVGNYLGLAVAYGIRYWLGA